MTVDAAKLLQDAVKLSENERADLAARLLESLDAGEPAYERFSRSIVRALEDEPIEDGFLHPADKLIEAAMRADTMACREWLARTLTENFSSRPALAGAILRCISRLDHSRVVGWGGGLVRSALAHRDVEVREAAIRALEAWGGDEAISLLRNHADSEPWLAEYTQRVIKDLSSNGK